MTRHLELATTLRAQLVDALEDIAVALEDPPPPHDGDELLDISLLQGYAGYALFYAYLDRLAPGTPWRRVGERHLERAIALVTQASHRPFFSYGFAGTGWALQHLSGWFVDVPPDAFDDIDAALLELVTRAPTVSFDLQHGLVGFGVYALERLPAPGARALLEAIVDRLARMAEPGSSVGMTWKVVNAEWTEGPGVFHAAPMYLPGVYQGVAGVIGVLAGALAAGVATREAARLLEGALAWTWGRPDIAPSLRATWMHGGLGVATATVAAAHAVGREDWMERALELARQIADERPRVFESGMFEGVAGAAHMFHRLYLASGDARFAAAAHAYAERLLRRRRTNDVGLVGFLRFSHAWQRGYLRDPTVPIGWVGAPGIHAGIAGIGLVVIALLDEEAPAWDRLFLMSLPTSGAR